MLPTGGGGEEEKSFEDLDKNVLGVGRVLDGTGGGGKDVWLPGMTGLTGILGRRPGCGGGVEGELGNRPPDKGGGPRGGAPPLGAGDLPPVGGIGGLAV